jgi:hypothetical protein
VRIWFPAARAKTVGWAGIPSTVVGVGFCASNPATNVRVSQRPGASGTLSGASCDSGDGRGWTGGVGVVSLGAVGVGADAGVSVVGLDLCRGRYVSLEVCDPVY